MPETRATPAGRRRRRHPDGRARKIAAASSVVGPRAGDHSQEVRAMNDAELHPTVTEIIEGPVASVDRAYAFDRLRDMCRAAPRAVRRVRTRLTAPLESTRGWQAAAEGTLLLDGNLIVCAGVTATTMREAIDLLMVRLAYRLRRLVETKRDQPTGSFPVSAA